MRSATLTARSERAWKLLCTLAFAFAFAFALALALALALGSGCAEPDLGDVPFYCNHGDPQCPEGYNCIQERCVRNGASLPDTQPWPDRGLDLPGPELITLDGTPYHDQPVGQDGPVKWDHGPPDQKLPPDQKVTKPDGWPPHLGCQSHSECTDSSSPCCCPMPLLPQIWACLPLCLNPFCI